MDLQVLFNQVSATGEPRFQRDEILHFLPFVLLSSTDGGPPPQVENDVASFLGAFLLHLGLDGDSPAEAVAARLSEYYEAHPVSPALLDGFLSVLRDVGKPRDRAEIDEPRNIV